MTTSTTHPLKTRVVKWTDEFEIWGEKVALQDMDQAQFADLLMELGEDQLCSEAIYERHIYKQLNKMYLKKFEGVDLDE